MGHEGGRSGVPAVVVLGGAGSVQSWPDAIPVLALPPADVAMVHDALVCAANQCCPWVLAVAGTLHIPCCGSGRGGYHARTGVSG